MAFRNQKCEIRLGNVESRLLGPCPSELLDTALNPQLASRNGRECATGQGRGSNPHTRSVYDPVNHLFLTGALQKVKRVLRTAGIRYRISDHRESTQSRNSWRLQGPELRDYQLEVVEKAIAARRGLIDLGTGAGKTILAAAITARLGLPTLVLVTTRVLMEQTRAALSEYLGTDPGLVGAGHFSPGQLTVGLVQSFRSRRTFESLWRNGLLIFDEGHHAAALTYLDVVRRIGPSYHYYLSAVPFRTGADQSVLDALAGPPLTSGRYSSRFLIHNGYACPIDVRIERCRIEGDMGEQTFSTLYRRFIVENRERNSRIVDIAVKASKSGRSVLILVEQVAHGSELLRLSNEPWPFLHGSVSRNRLSRELKSFAEGSEPVLVATSALLQEGISIHGIEMLIQAGGLKSRSKVIQSVGRGMRISPGKTSCVYCDFYDEDSFGVFLAHSIRRFRTLKEQGFSIPALPRSHDADTDCESLPLPEAAPDAVTQSHAQWIEGSDDPEPAWHHLPGSRQFLLVRADGCVLARGECIWKDVVPVSECKKCSSRRKRICEQGGRITWQEDPDRTSSRLVQETIS